MDLAGVTKIFEETSQKAVGMEGALKFVLDQGVVHVDFTGEQPSVTNEDKDADCTITTSIETLEAVSAGKQNPMMAVMTGKIKIKGDMGMAMKIQQLFS